MYTFLKISLRHLWQNRLYAIINIVGLATAIACMLLAVLYWKDERSFDNFHKNNPELYRITTNIVQKDGTHASLSGTGQVQGPAFLSAVPEMKNYVRILGGGMYTNVSSGSKTFRLETLFVDDSFFDVFTFPLLKGDPKTVLKDINSVVITETAAKKYFNTIDVVGKFLQMDADPSFEKLGQPLMISGVVKDPPKNSSLQFDALYTFKFMRLSFEDSNWLNAYLGTFVVLRPDADLHAVTEKFNKIYARNSKAQLGTKEYDIYGYDPQITYGLQPIQDIHLNLLAYTTGDVENGIVQGSKPVYSYMFMGIALFILLMAAINFINISIANSFKRSKEIGVRKISGGSRAQIIIQLLNESAILCFIAFFLALLSTNLLLPLFNNVSGKQLVLRDAIDLKLVGYFGLLLIVIVLLTGLYPALVLSNFNAAKVLYNKQKLSGRNLFGRGLVVLQFSLAIFLLIATLVYYNQMDYIRTKDLGYDPNQIIRTSVYGDRDYQSVIRFLKNELAKEPAIAQVSFGNDGETEDIEVNNLTVKGQIKNIDENFLSLMSIPLQAGRNLSPGYPTDKVDGALVNEAFVKAFALEQPIGTSIKINRYYDSSMKMIRGVVKDFHFGSLREPIKPMVMYMRDWPDGGIWVKFEKEKEKEALAALQRVYMKAMPKAIFDYQYLDELNAKQYFQEQRWQQVINVATVISIVLCCLGLFGLTHLSANQRIKEIGIRKVLGARSIAIAAMLSKDFLRPVLYACAVAFPIAWLVMNSWLRDYAYRIEMSWWILLLAGIAAVAIAMATVSYQALKAATSNPVDSLRNE